MQSFVIRFFYLVCFKLHPCHSMYQDYISFYCQITFHWWKYCAHLSFQQLMGHLGYFCQLATMNNFDMKIHIKVFMWTNVLFIWGMIHLRLTFWGTARLFSKEAAQYYIITSLWEGSNLCTSSSTCVLAVILISRVISVCAKWCFIALPKWQWFSATFHVIIDH